MTKTVIAYGLTAEDSLVPMLACPTCAALETALTPSIELTTDDDLTDLADDSGVPTCEFCNFAIVYVGQVGTVGGVRATITAIHADKSIDVRVHQGEWRVESAEFTLSPI